jgi:hypothetical protein
LGETSAAIDQGKPDKKFKPAAKLNFIRSTIHFPGFFPGEVYSE